MKTTTIIIAIATLAACGPLGAKTKWSPIGQGRLEIRTPEFRSPEKGVPSIAPLKHTDVKIKVRGFVAEVTVRQEFSNPLNQAIEAEYVFPLPHGAAVNATEMRIGKRVIRGRIAERDEARRKYEEARDKGKRAALLEQERPNIFTQSVANIGPGETIHVVIRYVQTLRYADGQYEVVFPMVVGPRYIPGNPLGAGTRSRRTDDANDKHDRAAPAAGHRRSGHGRVADTDQVPDASRITPHVLKPTERCGFDISIAVDIDAGVPVEALKSRAHRVTIERSGESKASVRLADRDVIPNKDFVLNIATAGKQPEIGLLAHHNGKGGYFTLVLQPPAAPASEQVRPREIICVLDCSGSMSGRPIQMEKRAVRKLLSSLGSGDRFNVLAFSDNARSFRAEPVAATDKNVRAAKAWVDRLSAGGGTEMLTGVRAALASPAPEDHLRIVAFFTDGYIGNDWSVIGEVQKLLRGGRLFSFGIGSSVNRFLIDRMAVAGRGVPHYILLADEPEETIAAFVERISRPVLTDVKLNVSGTKVHGVTPEYIPDVFAGVPIYIHGRYDKPGKATVEIVGRIGTTPSAARIDVTLPGPGKDSSPLPGIWARENIRRLEMERQAVGDINAAIVRQITDLALEYSLMSAYTSFVAIDETPTAFGGRPKLVPVKVPMPEGVCYETTIQNPNMSSGGSYSGGGPGLGLFGGGSIGPIVLGIVGVWAAMELLRRRRGKTWRK